MSASIILKNLRVHTVIGVYDQEKLAPQALRLDLELRLQSAQASITDRLRDTIDYDSVIRNIREFSNQSSFELLERYTYQLARHLLQQFPLANADITAWKSIAIHAPTEIAVRVQMQAGEDWQHSADPHRNQRAFDDEYYND
jgi:7,8-dihydroneopterin aldolase/epimerase/oxygenase